MIKRYIALNNLYLSTFVMVDGKEFSVVFKGGVLKPQRRNGQYITSDVKVQNALMNDSGYGKVFKEIVDESVDVKKKQKIKRVKKDDCQS